MKIKKLSEKGKYHRDKDEDNQDALCLGSNKSFCVISLADGASTCRRSKAGAETAARAITDLFLKAGKHFFEFGERKAAELILAHILYELKKCAEKDGRDLNEYSCTVSSVLFDKRKKKALCFNLGDGIIMAVCGGKCRAVCLPSDSSEGCCVTTTENAAETASVKIYDGALTDSVIICSDGAWRVMFNKNNRLKPETETMLINSEFDRLAEFLVCQNSFDDYSFISLDMHNMRRKKRRITA